MTIKTFSMGLAIAMVSAVLAAVMAVVGAQHFAQAASANAATTPQTQSAWQKFTHMFSSAEEETQVLFVEINNIMVSLKNDGGQARYMLLELALTAKTEEAVKQTEMMIPAIRGATVALLTEKDYSLVRTLSVNDLHDELMGAYQARFKQLNSRIPFDDVIISKMLLQ
ncbi:flagellar basal body-associated FliL family protein [Buttiauxella warmboldiae]|uniref:Flagellar protein FliL n=1 Tax=Buttiauxella warmboldiae TaxID=82993 RepID=A0A3N5EE99_9ENTR|nr:flagellar basal body-associated FliL family protein [Buttiauxella warmboldiae]RPH29432.1 flagellar basal body-associated FliL family protein [Buttiauxella warmboldiae]